MQNAIRFHCEFARAICIALGFVAIACFCAGCATPEPGTGSFKPISGGDRLQVEDRTGDQTIKDFLCWYNDNYKSLQKVRLVTNSPPTGDDTKYYSVNFEGTERWLKLLQESGFVSAEFLAYWRAYFKEAEKAFRNDPVSDGPAAGFEYDFIYNSQEGFPLNEDIQHATVTQGSIDGDKSTFVLHIPNYGTVTKTLVKSRDGNWQMAK